MKRFIACLLIFTFVLGMLPAAAIAEFDPKSVSTPYIVLMDCSTGAVLYEKQGNAKAFPASTTKIMTAILAIEANENLETLVTVGEDVESKGSLMNISRAEQLRLIDLLYGMMLKSGNDAAKAIAEFVSGSETAFAELMNKKAIELGMLNTHFVKPNGLHKDDHVTTAYDMALLTRYAMKNEAFRTIVSAHTYQVPPTSKDSDGYLLENTNKLLYTKEGDTPYTYQYAIGVKTGDTTQAGRCLVSAAQKDGVELILVLLGDIEGTVSGDYRYQNAAGFFDWGFQNYASVNASDLKLSGNVILPVSNASFDDAENGNITLNVRLDGVSVSGLRTDIDAISANPDLITSSYELNRSMSAPITAGEVLGTITYSYEDKTLFKADLIASRDVMEIGAAANPSPSPLLMDAPGDQKSGGNSWVFWVLVAVVLLLAIVILRLVNSRKKRMRRTKRRRPSYRVYRR
ncbi:MAG: D-alanyl-D-alanine carboxypeptidase family protein [Clostridia bacterium]